MDIDPASSKTRKKKIDNIFTKKCKVKVKDKVFSRHPTPKTFLFFAPYDCWDCGGFQRVHLFDQGCHMIYILNWMMMMMLMMTMMMRMVLVVIIVILMN